MAVVKPEMLDMNEIVHKIISNLEIKFKQANAKILVDKTAIVLGGHKAGDTDIYKPGG
jgi:hypothetical protein